MTVNTRGELIKMPPIKSTIEFTVNNISELNNNIDKLFSQIHYVDNVPWQINVTKQEYEGEYYLTVYPMWIIEEGGALARGNFTLVSSDSGKNVHDSFDSYHEWTADSHCGFPTFIEWNTLMDEGNGYIHDDKIEIIADMEFVLLSELVKTPPTKTTINFTIENMSELGNNKEKLFSQIHYVGNAPWQMNVTKKEIEGKYYMTVYPMWIIEGGAVALGDFTMKSSDPGKNIQDSFDEYKLWTADSHWGFPGFIEWDELMDQGNGYIQNDRIEIIANMEFVVI